MLLSGGNVLSPKWLMAPKAFSLTALAVGPFCPLMRLQSLKPDRMAPNIKPFLSEPVSYREKVIRLSVRKNQDDISQCLIRNGSNSLWLRGGNFPLDLGRCRGVLKCPKGFRGGKA